MRDLCRLSIIFLLASCSSSPNTDTGPNCNVEQHACDTLCASNLSIESCGPSSCTPCAPPDHSTATCDGVECGFICDDGYYENAGACVVCSSCAPGTFKTAACHANYDTVCTTCVDGSFSLTPDATSCVSCSTCAAPQYLAQDCSAAADTVCGDISVPSPIASPSSSTTYGSVLATPDATTGSFVATWADADNNQYPTYSIYTPATGWSAIAPIVTNSQAVILSNVVTSSDPTSGKFLATWTDSPTNSPTAAVYSPDTGWSHADFLPGAAARNTTNTFDSKTGQFLVTWADKGHDNAPTYAFYSLDAGWGEAAAISTSSPAVNIATTYDPVKDQFLAVWSDAASGLAKYSVFSAGAWSAQAPIGTGVAVSNDVFVAGNPATGKSIATWADINQSNKPFYSVFNGSAWTVVATIDSSSSVGDNVTVILDPTTSTFLAAWSDGATGYPTYSFLTQSTGWSPLATISTTAASSGDIDTAFDRTTGQILATWADSSDPNQPFNPSYALFEN